MNMIISKVQICSISLYIYILVNIRKDFFFLYIYLPRRDFFSIIVPKGNEQE